MHLEYFNYGMIPLFSGPVTRELKAVAFRYMSEASSIRHAPYYEVGFVTFKGISLLCRFFLLLLSSFPSRFPATSKRRATTTDV